MVFLCSDGLRKLALGIAGEQFRLRDAWRSLQVRPWGGLDLRTGMWEFEVKKCADRTMQAAAQSHLDVVSVKDQGPQSGKQSRR